MKKYTHEEIIEQFNTFSDDKYSLMISTSNQNNEPQTSYSPFVQNEGDYYICISSQMPHYTNMIESSKAHIMIIEDEVTASNIYARKRLYFGALCELVNNEDDIFELFDVRYGDKLSFMKSMKDFKILKLTPKEKSLVLGFGAAYKMDVNGELVQKNIQHK